MPFLNALAGWDVLTLTTVSQDIPGMVSAATGNGAATFLLFILMTNEGDPLPPRRVVLEPTMVHRRTHGPPPDSPAEPDAPPRQAGG